MDRKPFLLAALLASSPAWGARIAPPEPFHLQRYEEDYAYLRDPEERHGVWDEIKYLKLTEDGSSYLTLGGELREKYEIYNNEDWGSVATPDKRLLHRIMLDSDVHINDNLRFFLELKSGLVSGNSYPPRNNLDVDDLDLNNLFVERKITLNSDQSMTPRFGMQELEYGGARLIAVREGPNVRQGFDGFKLILNRGQLQWDNLWVLPVPTNPGIFEDHPSFHQQLWASYLTQTTSAERSDSGFDLYYLLWRNDAATFNAGTGDELRHSIGARIFKKPKARWDYDAEATFQFGNFRDQSIQAFMLAADTGFTFEHWPSVPRLALKASIASGDSNQGNGSLGTFNPLFPRRNLIDPSFVMGGANMVNVAPFAIFHPSGSTNVTVGYNSFWRESTQDGIYSPSVTVIRTSAGAGDPFIGAGPWVNAGWQVNRHINLIAVYVHTSAGGYIQESGPSSDVDYGALYAYFVF